MNIPQVPKPTSPAFSDKVITQMQDILKSNLNWLDFSFGRAQKLAKIKDQKNYLYPGIHIGNGTYINVFPDQSLGNYSYFEIDDPQSIDFKPKSNNIVRANYALIFWFNLNNIFPGISDRNVEAIKDQIVDLIARKINLSSGRVTIDRIYEKPENIYKGYSIREVDSQYLMQPYGGLRIEGVLTFIEGGCL